MIRTSAASLGNWHLQIPWLTGTIDWNLWRRRLLVLLLLPLPWVVLWISFLHLPKDFMVRRESLGYEDLSGGMTIVIRLESATPETGTAERAAGSGKRDKRIQHLFLSRRVVGGRCDAFRPVSLPLAPSPCRPVSISVSARRRNIQCRSIR